MAAWCASIFCVCVRVPAGREACGSLFGCGTFDDPTLAGIVLQEEEISAYRLARVDRALPLLSGPVRRRVAAAVRKPGRIHYLEDGRPVR